MVWLKILIDLWLLATVVETFKIEFITSFELNPAHYLSASGCIWNVKVYRCLVKTSPRNWKASINWEHYKEGGYFNDL